MRRRGLAVAITAMVFITQIAGVSASTRGSTASAAATSSAPIDRTLQRDLAAGRAHRIIVEFKGKADLRAAAKVKDRTARGQAVIDALSATAGSAQRASKATAAKAKGVTATTHWLTNVMVVDGPSAALSSLATTLAKDPNVSAVRAERIYPLVAPLDPKVAILAAAGTPEWGVAKIRADVAWDQGILGQGVVVASIDTGVDYTHPALVEHYRGNNHDGTFTHDYNWWDPSGSCPTDAPCDNVAHGTHTMGTMVGGDGPGPFTPDIGVAPGAQWIAAKGCEDLGCSETSLLSSGEWILAPTDLAGLNPNPAVRPDIVNNSWGSGPDDPFFQATVNAWRAAGIIPVFASGNPGPGCGDGGSPGDYLNTFSVGATDKDDLIADFSGRGPSVFGKVNPDVSAPGVDVVSSVPGGGYEAFSGTSMATPHTVGTLALVLSADPSLRGNVDAALNVVRSTAVDRIDDQCGGDDDLDPNNVYGDGRIDAGAAANVAATGGTLSGIIRDATTHDPVGGARVTANDGTRDFSIATAADGSYEMLLAAGTYSVSVNAFGYFGSLTPGITIATDLTTTHDVDLVQLPRFTVSGLITTAESGQPLPGVQVRAVGTPVAPVTSNASGVYSLVLPIGTYTLSASADGCTETGTAEIVSAGEDVNQPFALFRKLDDFGHACGPIALDWVDVEGQTALVGDDVAGRLRLPFSFPFYGESYDKAYVSSNGNLNFLEPNVDFLPRAIPSASAPNAAIYAFWADLLINDDDSSVDYGVVGDAPNRAFIVEYEDVQVLGSTASLDLEVKLWEDGTIDLLYGSNPVNPGDGRLATVGIENAAGTDALQIGFLERVLPSGGAIRITTVPTGFIGGTVTDRNDGLPIAGAVVTAQPGGRHASTADDGTYRLRLRAGTYQVTATADLYVDGTTSAVVVDDATTTADFSLAAPTAVSDTTTIDMTVQFGQTAHRTVTLSNGGSAGLDWRARERSGETVFPPLPEPTKVLKRTPIWGHQATPKGLAVVRPTDTSDVTLDTIINDPIGDSLGSVDVGTVRAGSDGSNVMSMALDFSAGTAIDQAVGYVFLDTDQNPDTGFQPVDFAGLPTQDIGVDYFLDLFGSHDPDPVIFVVNGETFEVTAVVPTTFDGQTERFDIPLEALGGDDGSIDTAMVLGDFFEPLDWAPDIGHGTIEPFSDALWLSETPADGQIAVGNHQAIDVALGGPDLTPGEYHAKLVFVTNAPKSVQVPIDVTLTVIQPAGFGAVTGTVTNAHTGDPLAGVGVKVHAQYPPGTAKDFVTTTAADGSYKIVGPSGTWPADFTLDGWVPVTRNVTIAAGVTTPGANVELHKIQPHATLDGDLAPVFTLLPGGTAGETLTLSNPAGHANLTFTIGERPRGSILAGAGGTATTAAGVRSSVAPAGHVARRVTPSISGEPSLVLMDVLPWDSDAIQQVLDANGVAFDQAGSADLATIDFTSYHAIYVGNDQPQSFYDVLFANEGRLTDFVNGGGFLWFGAAAFGFQDGDLDGAILPGGLTVHGPAYEDENAVVTPDHPLMAGVPNPIEGTSASHVTFSDLPDGATVIAAGTISGDPTLVDYDLGAGHVVAVGQPVEFGFAGDQDTGLILQNGVPFAEEFSGLADVPWLSETPVEGTIAPDGSLDIAVSVDATGLEPGVHRASIIIKTNDPDHGAFVVPVTLVVPAFQQGVNAGGKQYLAPDGTVYAADQEYKPAPAGGPAGPIGRAAPTTWGYVKGDAHKTDKAIDGTDEDVRYQSQREGATGYRFEVPNGVYKIDLSFAEFHAKKVGERVFGVTIEDDEVVAALDVFKRAGGQFIAYDQSFIVEVSDGVLAIDFPMPRGHKSIVNSIVVTQLPPGAPGT